MRTYFSLRVAPSGIPNGPAPTRPSSSQVRADLVDLEELLSMPSHSAPHAGESLLPWVLMGARTHHAMAPRPTQSSQGTEEEH